MRARLVLPVIGRVPARCIRRRCAQPFRCPAPRLVVPDKVRTTSSTLSLLPGAGVMIWPLCPISPEAVVAVPPAVHRGLSRRPASAPDRGGALKSPGVADRTVSPSP